MSAPDSVAASRERDEDPRAAISWALAHDPDWPRQREDLAAILDSMGSDPAEPAQNSSAPHLDHDAALSADEWEAAKREALLLVAADRLSDPNDHLGYIRARLSEATAPQ